MGLASVWQFVDGVAGLAAKGLGKRWPAARAQRSGRLSLLPQTVAELLQARPVGV